MFAVYDAKKRKMVLRRYINFALGISSTLSVINKLFNVRFKETTSDCSRMKYFTVYLGKWLTKFRGKLLPPTSIKRSRFSQNFLNYVFKYTASYPRRP